MSAVRKILRQYPDGLTAQQIAGMCKRKDSQVNTALVRMPDAYIDRWTPSQLGGPMCAVWCVVIPPEDCPHP